MADSISATLATIVAQLEPSIRARTEATIEALQRTGISPYHQLLTLLQDGRQSVQLRSAIGWLLGRFHGGEPETLPALLKVVADDDNCHEVRKECALALGTLDDGRILVSLLDALDSNTDPGTRLLYMTVLTDLTRQFGGTDDTPEYRPRSVHVPNISYMRNRLVEESEYDDRCHEMAAPSRSAKRPASPLESFQASAVLTAGE